MNTISINAEQQTASLQAARTLATMGLGLPRRSPPVAWLPVPSAPRTGIASQRRTGKTRAQDRPARSDSTGEKIFFGLLVLAAALAIGYGFSCMVDLVQNWG